MYLTKTSSDDRRLKELAEDRDKWRSLVPEASKLRFLLHQFQDPTAKNGWLQRDEQLKKQIFLCL